MSLSIVTRGLSRSEAPFGMFRSSVTLAMLSTPRAQLRRHDLGSGGSRCTSPNREWVCPGLSWREGVLE
eukprot:2125763-Pyramimonas_sp.AAC.2